MFEAVENSVAQFNAPKSSPSRIGNIVNSVKRYFYDIFFNYHFDEDRVIVLELVLGLGFALGLL